MPCDLGARGWLPGRGRRPTPPPRAPDARGGAGPWGEGPPNLRRGQGASGQSVGARWPRDTACFCRVEAPCASASRGFRCRVTGDGQAYPCRAAPRVPRRDLQPPRAARAAHPALGERGHPGAHRAARCGDADTGFGLLWLSRVRLRGDEPTAWRCGRRCPGRAIHLDPP